MTVQEYHPIVMLDGRQFKKHGVPSRSWFTQIVNSIVNHIYVCFLSELHGLEARNIRVLGDDSGFKSRKTIDQISVSKLSTTLFKALNVRLTVEKSEVVADTPSLKLLGYRYGGGHRVKADSE